VLDFAGGRCVDILQGREHCIQSMRLVPHWPRPRPVCPNATFRSVLDGTFWYTPVPTLYDKPGRGIRTSNYDGRMLDGPQHCGKKKTAYLRAKCGLLTTINPHTSQSVGTSHALAPHLGQR